MWTWVDGHLLLVAILCPPVAWASIAATNAWLRARHIRQRADIFAKRGA
jgi:hypothetical protein